MVVELQTTLAAQAVGYHGAQVTDDQWASRMVNMSGRNQPEYSVHSHHDTRHATLIFIEHWYMSSPE